MKILVLLFALIRFIIPAYDRNGAVSYAKKIIIKKIMIVVLNMNLVLHMHILEWNIVIILHMEEIVQIL